jgi:hypothetical protein
MKILKLSLILLATGLAAGCSTQWTRPGTAEQQAADDLELCEEQAMEAHPPLVTGGGPNYQAQNSVGCVGSSYETSCRAKPGSTLRDPNQDLNRASRERAVAACMEAQGYSQN